MAVRISSRYLAPLALGAVSVGVAIVVLGGAGGGGGGTSQARDSGGGGACKPRHTRIIVHTGDTLTALAKRNCVDIKTIERLNPTVDPANIHKGLRLRLQ